MARYFEKLVYEATSTNTVEQTVATLDFNTIFGLGATDRFTAHVTIRVWSYNASASDAEASGSHGAFDKVEDIVINRDPKVPTLQYVPNNNGSPGTPSPITHVKGRDDMVTAIKLDPTAGTATEAVLKITAGAATEENSPTSETIEHMIAVDIDLFSET